jgi:opacity protein-like surface antigen
MSSHKSYRRRIAIASVLGATIGGLALPTKLSAADIELPVLRVPPPVQTQRVEFGTGWYIRGDLGYARESLPPISSDLSQYTSSAPTYSFNGDIGVGYKFNNWFRTDVTGEYRAPISASGPGAGKTCITALETVNNVLQTLATDTCTPQSTASIGRWAFLANGYVDMGTWYGFTPYVGAGGGFSITNEKSSTHWYMSNGLPYQVTTDGFYYDWDVNSGTARYQIAWALMGGVSYAITPHFLLDLGYRYINLGTLPGIANSAGQIVTKPMDAQEIRIGLRYMID